jgi:hypothetical protein
MKKLTALLALLFILSASTPSQAWVRAGFHGGWHGGGHGGWHGPHIGVTVGPGPWWWYDPYYYHYDSYYDPYYSYYPYAPYPYAYAPYPYPYVPSNPGNQPQSPSQTPYPGTGDQESEQAPKPDNTRHNLKYINSMIAHARASVNYEYEDGDITQAQKDAALRNIEAVEQEAKSQAAAQGGTITGDQERALWDSLKSGNPPTRTATPPASESSSSASPSTSIKEEARYDLKGLNDQIERLRSSLAQKQAAGDITKAQHDAESNYLSQLEKVARAEAKANGGKLTDSQESALREELLRVDNAIQQNLVVR